MSLSKTHHRRSGALFTSEARPAREISGLGTPEPLTEASTSYAFIALQVDGVTPIAYDPCRPVHVVIRPDNEPEGGRQMILDAITRVSRATGLVFVDDGATTESFTPRRASRDPARYGDRWSPVLIGWQTADENPDLASDVLGEGGSSWIGLSSGGPQIFVNGQVGLLTSNIRVRLDRERILELDPEVSLAPGSAGRLAASVVPPWFFDGAELPDFDAPGGVSHTFGWVATHSEIDASVSRVPQDAAGRPVFSEWWEGPLS